MAPQSAKARATNVRSTKMSVIPLSEQILVLGIDPGTTSFKVAALEACQESDRNGNIVIDKDPYQQIIPLSHFPGFERIDSNTVPTALVYNAKGELTKWGHHAINFQTDNRFDPEFFIAYWKLGLRTSSSPAARCLRRSLEASAKRLGTTPDKFIEDFFRVVRKFVLEDEKSPLLGHLGGKQALREFKYIDFVIALPPGWPRQEHRAFTSAVTQGLGEDRQIRIFTVSETESVLNQWITEPRHRKKVKVGDIVVLLDLGGGTACISTFRCVAGPPGNEKFKWEHLESHSLTAGSQIVTEGFMTDFQHRLSEVGILSSNQLNHRVRKEFDEKKLSIGEEKHERNWSIDVDGLKRDDKKGLGNGKMWFTGEQLLGYFQVSQDQILEKLNEVMSRVAGEHSTSRFCVVAGAYGNNVIFKERLKAMNTMKNFGMDINFPNYGGEAVVRGACLARVEGEFSQSSGSRYSVAVLTYMHWEEAMKHFPAAAVRTFDGEDTLYSPVLEWKIKKGDPVVANHTIAADSDQPRQRRFSDKEEIVFDDTIYTSECHPGEGRYTYLKYKTSNSVEWKSNEVDLLERGIEVKAFQVTWDLRNTSVLQNGSYKPLTREALPINRAKKMSCLNYKYHISVGQIDIKLYIESFFTKRRRDMMAMSHKQIVVMDEPESATLVQEYEHLPEFREPASHKDGRSLAGEVSEKNVASLGKHLQERIEEPPTPSEQDLRHYYSANSCESQGASAKRQKLTQSAAQEGIPQSAPPSHMLQEVAVTAIHQAGSSACLTSIKEHQEGVSGPQATAGPTELFTNRPRYSTQRPDSRISLPQVNLAERDPASQLLQPLSTSSPNSLRRPRQEIIAALRTPVVEPRKRDLWAISRSRRNSKNIIDPFK